LELISRTNQWKPKELRIDVNGKEFGSYAINQRLKAGQSAWVKIIRPMSQEKQFVRTLRAIPNGKSSHSAEYIAGASTIFKNLGISGWKDGPISQATVAAVSFIRQAAVATDT
jgi:hypothetical protein